MPSLLVCALLGLAVAVLLDVARAPGPSVSVIEIPIVIMGLDRLRRAGSDPGFGEPTPGLFPAMGGRALGTTFFLEDVLGEVELRGDARSESELVELPSVIVED